MSLEQILRTQSVVVCCGTGGVGKTSIAAALALSAAQMGRRAIVITIDPARRLADAIGLREEIGNEPVLVKQIGDGQMWATMLDVGETFDSLVTQFASDAEQVTEILNNTFYRNVSRSLSGTRDYIAAERLLALQGDDRFDLVIVDTPPTRSALAFVEAPERLARFLEHRLFRLLISPTLTGMKLMTTALQPVVRTAGKIVGAAALDDAIAFLQAFAGMEDGFRQRARQSATLLRGPVTSFVLVASARADTLEEASYFADGLQRNNIAIDLVIANRMPPRFGDTAAEVALTHVQDPDGDLWRNLAQLHSEAEQADAQLAQFMLGLTSASCIRIAERSADIIDLDGITDLAASLLAP